MKRIVSLLPRRDWLVVGWVLAIKLLLLIFGVRSYQIIQNRRVLGLHGWFEIWNRWDSLTYQRLAEFGYNTAVDLKAWPLFPWCVRVVGYLCSDYLVGALIISGVASVVAAILLRRLVALDYAAAVAQRAVWFFLIFPTAYFLHVGYTESFFLALTLGCIMAARTQRWELAGLLGTLACMTRANGFVLVPTLLVEAAHQYFATKRWQWRWLWIAIMPLGLGVFLLLNWRITGDPFAFLRMRRELSATTLAWPWEGISELIRDQNRAPFEAEMVGAQELYFVVLSLVCTIMSWIKLRPLYAMWITGNWLGVAGATFISGAPRYTLTMFPIFMLFALLAANRLWHAIITVWSLLFLALFVSLFVRGWWAF